MHHITFTQLRTDSNELSLALRRGEEVKLIRRSRIIGTIIPNDTEAIKQIDAKKLQAKINQLGFKKLTSEQIDKRYRTAMMKKHGKSLR
jgi:antitoxin (DNA-binding transcriptional repressor) of toxin-antitoxin stability system